MGERCTWGGSGRFGWGGRVSVCGNATNHIFPATSHSPTRSSTPPTQIGSDLCWSAALTPAAGGHASSSQQQMDGLEAEPESLLRAAELPIDCGDQVCVFHKGASCSLGPAARALGTKTTAASVAGNDPFTENLGNGKKGKKRKTPPFVAVKITVALFFFLLSSGEPRVSSSNMCRSCEEGHAAIDQRSACCWSPASPSRAPMKGRQLLSAADSKPHP